MKRVAVGLWGLLVLGSAACSDRGTVVADTNGMGGSSGAAGAEPGAAGDGDVEHTGGVDAASGGSSSGTAGRPAATGGNHNGDAGSAGTTGGRSQGTAGATGGSVGDTGGTAAGGTTHSGGANTGGRVTGGAGGSDGGTGGETGGAGEGVGGSSGGTGGNDEGAAGAAGSTTCTTEACCASVEFVQESLGVYLIDGQFYFDGTVELVDGPLDLNGWLATVELSSEPTWAVEGPMARSQGRQTRTYWVGSTGSSASGIECGQTLTFQVRVRTDTELSNSASGCVGVYGPSLTIQATVQCPTCPEDAEAARVNGETCEYPVTLECPGIITDNEGVPGAIGCPCVSLFGEARHWECPHI